MVERTTNERNQNTNDDKNDRKQVIPSVMKNRRNDVTTPKVEEVYYIDNNITDPTSSSSSSSASLLSPPILPQQTFYYKSNADQDMIRTTLQKSIYFSCLDEEQIETFVQSVQLQQFQPGQIIITEGCIDATMNSNSISSKKNTNDSFNGSNDTSHYDRSPSNDTGTTVVSDIQNIENDESCAILDTTTLQPVVRPHHTDNNNDETDDNVPHRMAYNDQSLSLVEEEHTTGSTVDDNDDNPNDTTTHILSNGTETGNRTELHDIPSSSATAASSLQLHEEIDMVNRITTQNESHKNENGTNDSDHWLLSNRPMKNERNNHTGIHVTNLESSLSSVPTSTSKNSTDPPIPPQSGIPRSIYIIRKGHAQIWYKTTNKLNKNITTVSRFGNTTRDGILVNTIGPGTIFGEGGFLFGRMHSASVIAAKMDSTTNHHKYSSSTENDSVMTTIEPLECWVLDIQTFREFVLPSTNMRQIFHRYAQRYETNSEMSEQPEPLYVTISDLLEAINEYHQLDPLHNNCTNQLNVHLITTLYDALIRLRLITSTTTTTTTNESNQRQHPQTSNPKNNEAKLYLNDFCFFFALLARPDPEVDVIFLLMDEHQTGCIGIHDLQTILQPIYPELDFTSEFFQRYFGLNGNQFIRFKSFSQFLVDLQREIGQQAYNRAVLKRIGTSNMKDGYLPPNDFVQILSTSCGWNLPSSLMERLDRIYCHDRNSASTCAGDEYFSYGDFMAFQDVLGNLSFICRLISRAEEFNDGPISADDFKAVNREFGLGERLSRRQVDIIYDLFDVNNDGYISHTDIVDVCGANFIRNVVPIKRPGNKLAFVAPSQNNLMPSEGAKEKEYDLLQKISTGLRNFSVAAVVGGVSVFLLHPIDLIKTRLMNQRMGATNLYRGPIDCLQQVIRKEGFLSLFRGVQPHVLGVAMERSIKLQVHQLLQQAFHAMDDEKDDDRKSSLLLESLAGGCAGACQLLVTNPMEITSIRMQMQGETARLLKERGIASPSPSTMLGVIKDLGFPGVYRGASACLIRDVPFSAIFFPSYVACKDILVQHNANFTGKATAADIFYAGTIAGIPASLLTTPADVVKCRLQSITRPGETSYSGIRDCVTKMYQNEGIFAFFQGSLMRVLRIAPQFGLSLLLYENLTNLTGFDKARRPPSNLPIDPDDYLNAFPRHQRNEPGFLDKWAHATFGHNEG